STALTGCEMSGARPAAVKTLTAAEKHAPTAQAKSVIVASAKDDVPLKPPTIELAAAKDCRDASPTVAHAVQLTIEDAHESFGLVIDAPLLAPAPEPPPPAPEAPAPRQLPAATLVPCSDFGHAPDFSWISGDVQKWRKEWRLRYAPLDESDE